MKGLQIGIADEEIYTFDTMTEHVVDGIAATATYTDHFDEVATGNIDCWFKY
jgi:hypothetical protein